MKPVVRNIQNSDLYFFEGGNKFKNIRSGNSGEVSDEVARKIFKFNVDATTMINEYPIIEDLIKSLNLKLEPK